MKKICILGLGYIGLPTAAMFATHGFDVVGVDVNDSVVELINNGDVHIHEPGLKTLAHAALKSGCLKATRQPEPADAFIIAVPTPLSTAHGPQLPDSGGPVTSQPTADLSYVIAAAESIVPYLSPGNLVVLESTVPPQTTTEVVLPILERSGIRVSRELVTPREGSTSISKGGDGVARSLSEARALGFGDDSGCVSLSSGVSELHLAHSPERVLPGRILKELMRNDRVIGGVSWAAAERAKALYASFVEGEILLTDATTAEMVKLMENTYRDVNIALANEFALVSEQMEVDVWKAIEIANRHPRVQILNPGPGVGGHCIAVDPWFLVQVAPAVTPLIQSARRVNDGMPRHVVGLVKRALSRLRDVPSKMDTQVSKGTVACLGLAYKADVDDVRESPALAVVALLQAEGFVVRAYDPHVPLGTVPGQVHSLEAAVEAADVIVVLTDHSEFCQMQADALSHFPGQVIIDTRNMLAKDAASPEGFVVRQRERLDSNLRVWPLGCCSSL